jgi:hypothetical protein
MTLGLTRILKVVKGKLHIVSFANINLLLCSFFIINKMEIPTGYIVFLGTITCDFYMQIFVYLTNLLLYLLLGTFPGFPSISL